MVVGIAILAAWLGLYVTAVSFLAQGDIEGCFVTVVLLSGMTWTLVDRVRAFRWPDRLVAVCFGYERMADLERAGRL